MNHGLQENVHFLFNCTQISNTTEPDGIAVSFVVVQGLTGSTSSASATHFDSIDTHAACPPCLTCRHHVFYGWLTRLMVPCCAAAAAYSGDGVLHTLPGAAVAGAAPS